MTEDLEAYELQIPSLKEHQWERKSDPDPGYNCIAWAAGCDDRPWWPPSHIGAVGYWPPGVPAWETLEAFVQAFETVGYARCDSPQLEDGVEKVVLYVSERTGTPTHAARQLESGCWTSKLGGGIDIEHDDLGAVAGSERLAYGRVGAVLGRSRAS